MVLIWMINASTVVGKIQLITLFLINCRFIKIFVNNVIDRFNAANNSKFAPTIEEKLFGITSGSCEKGILKKFNYTKLFMKYYIYTIRCITKLFTFLSLLTKFIQVQNRKL